MTVGSRRRVLITGGGRGLGYAAAARLAAAGDEVIVTARRQPVAEDAAASLRAQVGGAVHGVALDLADLTKVRTVARGLVDDLDRLDVVVANAVSFPPRRWAPSAQGHELTFAVAHLGHAAVVLNLMPLLSADGGGRVVVVTSRLHDSRFPRFRARLSTTDPELRGRGYRPMRAYRNAKLANLLFTYELDRRYRGIGVRANALCPGFVPATIGDQARGLRRFTYRYLLARMPFAGSLDQAVDTYQLLADDPVLDEIGGAFYTESRPARSSTDSYDRHLAEWLWAWTLQRIDPTDPTAPA